MSHEEQAHETWANRPLEDVVLRGPWIDAMCLVFPNGQTAWVDSREYMEKCLEAWKRKHPEYVGTEATMGAVEVRMPRCVFEGMQTTNEFPWPTA